MYSATLTLTLSGLVTVLLLAACGNQPPESVAPQPLSSEAAEGSPVPAGAIVVQTIQPQRRDLARTLSLPANVSPWVQATLFAKVPGYLKWMGADKGDEVKSGQSLALIDAPEIEQQLQEAEADYRIKQLTFQRLHNAWQANPEVVAKQDVDVAESAAKASRHLRDRRRTQLEYTKVSAPFSGTITARFADPGALIQSASGSATQAAPLFTLMDLSTIRVYISVPQETALKAKPGTKAVVSVREIPGQEFHTTVARTTEALDPATRTLLVELNLPNKAHDLRPGMFVTARLVLEEHPQVLAIPPAALVSTGSGKSVFIVEDGRAKQVPVKTGLDDGLWVEVIEGLQDHMEVVLVGKAGLTNGQPLRTSPYNLPPGKPASQKL